NGCIVALKYVATGKYLSSISGLNYITGSYAQLVFANNLLDSDALWNIIFSGNELASYTNTTNIYLQHKSSSYFLGIYNDSSYKSPVTQHTEVFLRSHDLQFTIGNDTFQEVVCHNERLGGNDE
ncbi:4731_t:CDS:2, partial [Funneliformis caledonium]